MNNEFEGEKFLIIFVLCTFLASVFFGFLMAVALW